jgi:hypothetical protein
MLISGECAHHPAHREGERQQNKQATANVHAPNPNRLATRRASALWATIFGSIHLSS